MKSTFLLLSLVLAAACPQTYSQQLGAQSGNTAGFSDIADAQLFTIPRPSSPGTISAVRINRNSIRVSIVPGSDVANLRIMRAAGNGKWDEIKSYPANLIPASFIDAAPAGENYKYLSQFAEFRAGMASTITSKPSGIAYVGDVAATMEAGQWSYDPFPNPATGTFSVASFFPNRPPETPATVDPNPYKLEGPFAEYKTQPGFITTRETLWAEASIESGGLWSYPYAEIQPSSPWTSFLLPPATGRVDNGNNSGHEWLLLGSQFGFYESRWSGSADAGYDRVSNPHWQMLPQNPDPRVVSLDIQPAIGTQTFGVNALGANITTINDTSIFSVDPGGSTLKITHSGGFLGANGSEILPGGLKVPLKLDTRPRVEISIKIVRLMMRSKWKGQIITDADADVPNPDLAALELELVQTYGSQANIFFTLAKQTIVHDDDDNETVVGEDTDGIAMFDYNSIPSPGSSSYSELARTNRSQGHMFTIFCVKAGGFAVAPGIPPEKFYGSFANNNNAQALFAVITSLDKSISTYAHETGHLLGLYHPWKFGTEYSEEVLPDHARERVMGYDRIGKRLTKPERDVIHAQAKRIREEFMQ